MFCSDTHTKTADWLYSTHKMNKQLLYNTYYFKSMAAIVTPYCEENYWSKIWKKCYQLVPCDIHLILKGNRAKLELLNFFFLKPSHTCFKGLLQFWTTLTSFKIMSVLTKFCLIYVEQSMILLNVQGYRLDIHGPNDSGNHVRLSPTDFNFPLREALRPYQPRSKILILY